ncbi:MAG: ABC transporter ATP-binding protein [Desulfobacteraceae bacterium]|jgi:putative ABC transport system ATP-binding protein
MNNQPLAEIKNLEKSYTEGEDKRLVLENADMDIFKGDITLLLGKSGSGKSTLLNLLSGIDRPDKGEINILGKDISKFSEKELTDFRRKNIGIVFQFFNLIPTLNVEENLNLVLKLNNIKNTGQTDWYLNETGLSDRKKTYPDRLSGGEQQRVSIARALIHEPEIILADEPTGNLDEKSGSKIIALFEKLVRQKNKTLVMVTHNRDLIKIADKVYSIKNRKFALEKGEP